MIRRVAVAAACACSIAGNSADGATPEADLGSKIGLAHTVPLSDRELPSYFGGLIKVTEVHAGDCGATMRIASGTLPVRTSIVALGRVKDCAGPKPVLAIRLTVEDANADIAGAAMRTGNGVPCLDGPDASAASSLVWANQGAVYGLVKDPPPGKAFSVFFVAPPNPQSADEGAEAGLRQIMLDGLPPACR